MENLVVIEKKGDRLMKVFPPRSSEEWKDIIKSGYRFYSYKKLKNTETGRFIAFYYKCPLDGQYNFFIIGYCPSNTRDIIWDKELKKFRIMIGSNLVDYKYDKQLRRILSDLIKIYKWSIWQNEFGIKRDESLKLGQFLETDSSSSTTPTEVTVNVEHISSPEDVGEA